MSICQIKAWIHFSLVSYSAILIFFRELSFISITMPKTNLLY